MHEVRLTGRPAVAILGSGPNRIGQGIEFDYCCVHAAMTVRESGPRRGDDQLQPGDGLHRLRHLRPPLLRAAHPGGRARRARARAPRGGDRPVRRPDPAQAGARAGRRRRAAARHLRGLDPPGRGPAELQRRCSTSSGLRSPPYATASGPDEALGAATQRGLPAARAAVVRARRAGDGDLLLRATASPTTCGGWAGTCPDRARSSSTASSRTPSRSTWTRSATATRCGSGRSCSTSRRPACTRATRPA